MPHATERGVPFSPVPGVSYQAPSRLKLSIPHRQTDLKHNKWCVRVRNSAHLPIGKSHANNACNSNGISNIFGISSVDEPHVSQKLRQKILDKVLQKTLQEIMGSNALPLPRHASEYFHLKASGRITHEYQVLGFSRVSTYTHNRAHRSDRSGESSGGYDGKPEILRLDQPTNGGKK